MMGRVSLSRAVLVDRFLNVTLVLVLFGVCLLTWQCIRHNGTPRGAREWAGVAFKLVSNDSIAAHLKTITVAPHIAGTPENMAAAAFVAQELTRSGFKTHTSDFPGLLGYPGPQTLSITHPTPLNLSLREGTFQEDPYSQDPRASTPFLGYSAPGSVTASVVYANFGRAEDFLELQRMGVSCQGLIVIMRYGEIYRGDKVANAAVHGAAAALIYSDPQQDAPDGTSPSQTYPNTQWLPDSGVQRGSIFGGVPGDPRTPGWPSCFQGCEAMSKEELYTQGILPTIPALPISYTNAHHILRDLGGPTAPDTWQGSLPGLVYRLGPGPVEVALSVESSITVATLRDVIGVFEGAEEPDRLVVVGNHRDAWVFGASDPNSGTTCLLEIARVLQQLTALGWKPRRTIVLASWDGEEHNLVGSTEWVERNLPLLSAHAVAYLNVDVAVSGPWLSAAATPQMDDLLRNAAGMVQDPDGPPGQSVLDSMKTYFNSSEAPIFRLGGGGSDFASFLQHAGIAATDFSFGGEYPMYHSLYDNFHWMSKFGDPVFARHVAATRILLAMLLNLTSESVIPFNFTAYSVELRGYVSELNSTLAQWRQVDLSPLWVALSGLEAAALEIQSEAQELLGVAKSVQRLGVVEEARLRQLNDRLMLAERGFLDPMGLSASASWYKHLVYGPEAGNGYGTDVFPALQDALTAAIGAGKDAGTDAGKDAGKGAGKGINQSGILHPGDLSTIKADSSNSHRRSLLHSAQKRRKRPSQGVLRGSEVEPWELVRQEVFRVARAISRVADILKGSIM